MTRLLFTLLSIFITLSASANVSSCGNLYESTDKSVREIKNSLLRLTNLKYGFNNIILSHRSGEKWQTLVILLEKPNANGSIREAVIEEMAYLQASLHVAPKIENGRYTLSDSLLNSDTNIFGKSTKPQMATVDVISRAETIRGQERRLVKFFAGAISFLPSAVFSAISFAIDLPGKEFVIPLASFTSLLAFKGFSGAINKHYEQKPLDAKREVELEDNRDVSRIYPYEILNQIDKFLSENGSQNDVHVILVPVTLEKGIKEQLANFDRLQEVTN